MEGKVIFKGRQSYLEVILEGGIPYGEALAQIREKMAAGRSFFSGSACVRVLGGNLTPEQQGELDRLFKQEYGIIATEFMTRVQADRLDDDDRRRRKAERVVGGGARPRPEKVAQAEDEPPLDLRSEVLSARSGPAVFVRETVRSGQKIVSAGDIVVLGDVNGGAHLIADGSIVVMGSLRGVAHAGASGDETATVSAVRLSPLQLRICSLIAIAPDGETDVDYPETAFIRGGAIEVTPLGRR